MGRRDLSAGYNTLPPVSPAPVSSASAPQPAASLMRNFLSALVPGKSSNPVRFSIPALPIGELLGGVSNTVKGLVLNDNWWVLLLIIFLFFPNISKRMFGGILKD